MRAYRRQLRKLRLGICRTRRAIIRNFATLPRRKVRRTKMRLRRFFKNLEAGYYRRYHRLHGKLAKRFKNSRIGGIYAGLSTSLGPNTRN